MFPILFVICNRYGGRTNDHYEETKKAIEYLPIFQNEATRLCKVDRTGSINYHQYVKEFLSFIRSSSLYDPEYVKHLEVYQPHPFTKIKTMDENGLRAILTLITKGESISGRPDYICKVIEKQYILQILQRLHDISQRF